MPESTRTHAATASEPARWIDLGMPSAIMALLATATVLAFAHFQANAIRSNTPLDGSFASSILLYWFGPQLLIIALVTTGFPRTCDIAAVFIAAGTGTVATILTLFTRDPLMAAVMVMQVTIFAFALVDLSHRRATTPATHSARIRLLGLVVPIVVGYVGYGIVDNRASEAMARRPRPQPDAVHQQEATAVPLPYASVSMPRSVAAGERFSPIIKFHPLTALDSVAHVTVSWGDTDPPVAESLPITSEQSSGAGDWNRFANHVYRSYGRHLIELTITTKRGGVYRAQGAVNVNH